MLQGTSGIDDLERLSISLWKNYRVECDKYYK